MNIHDEAQLMIAVQGEKVHRWADKIVVCQNKKTEKINEDSLL